MSEAARGQVDEMKMPIGVLVTGASEGVEVMRVLECMRVNLSKAFFLEKPFRLPDLIVALKQGINGDGGCVVHVEDDDVLRGIVGDLIDFQSIPCVSFRTNDEAREALTVDNGAITVEIGGAQKKVMVLLLDLLVPGQTTTEELVCCIGRMISSQPIEKVQ